ncbi:MAG TPA: hypothetical protein VM032_09050, partial [Vicinamibacterales bacterium]|nr:hypothetical protein [Vicinamibacterales bacterium]
RVAHHHDEADQFKWLYDIHLIASRFTDSQWAAFASLVVDRGIAAVSLDSLERASRWFGTVIPRRIQDDARFVDAASREATAGYLRVRPKARELLDDVWALGTWRERFVLVREHLLPGPDYMTRVYAPGSRLPVPLLYVTRLLRGAGGWITRRPAARR